MSSSNFSPKSSNGNGAPLKEKSHCSGERSAEGLKIHSGKKFTLKTKKAVAIKKQLVRKNMLGQKKAHDDFIRECQNKLNNTVCQQDIKIKFCGNNMEKNFFDSAVQNAKSQNQNIVCEQKNMDQHLKVGDKGEFWGSDSLGRGV